MSMENLIRDVKHMDRACDAMAQACFELGKCNDWIGIAQLHALEGMLDDLGSRVDELRHVKKVMDEIAEANDGTTGC